MIRHLLLDVDNTLYPQSHKMDQAITHRMYEYTAKQTGLPLQEAIELRKQRLPNYGSTLEWLRNEHDLINEQDYFEYVHPENELDEIKKDSKLRPFLLSLELPLTVLTNSPMFHAKRVLEFLDIADLFTHVYDVTKLDGRGKPHADCFQQVLRETGHRASETLFLDDYPKYVLGFKQVDGNSVLVDEFDAHVEFAQNENIPRIHTIYEVVGILERFNG
jgi:putative hydrolase of the HAD superfamily